MFRKSLKAAVAALAAAVALTACGPFKPGAAAILGHDRITDAKLDSAVRQWGRELPRFPDAQQFVDNQRQQQQRGQDTLIPLDLSSAQRSALYQLIDIRVWDELARQSGVHAGPGQVDSFVTAFGGAQAFDPFVLAHGLPTSYRDDVARRLLTQQLELRRYGIGGQTNDPQAQQQAAKRLVADYSSAAHRLGITVNPRYGSFDYQPSALRVRALQIANGLYEYQIATFGSVCPHLSTPDSGTPGSDNGVKCLI